MTQHARGRVAATPDIAGDMERTLTLASLCAVPFPDEVEDLLLGAVVDAVTTAETGDCRDHVVGALVETTEQLLESRIRSASRELAEQIGIPAAALRTRNGRSSALMAQGHGDDALERIDSLPGTSTVLGVRELESYAQHRRRCRNGELSEALAQTWDMTPGTGASVDAVTAERVNVHPRVVDLAWSLINLEGRRHVNLIWHQANKLQRSFPDREASELLTWGWIGLRTALRNYNPSLGFAFSTYACTRIVGAIRDGVRAESPIPKRLGTMARKAAAVEADLVQSLGRTPTFEEITQALSIESATLQAIRRTRTPLSIEEIVAGIDRTNGNEPAWLASPEDAETAAIGLVDAERIAAAVAGLPADEAEAIRLLVIEDRSPTEARQIAGVTARQLRQRKERAIASLRSALSDLDLAD